MSLRVSMSNPLEVGLFWTHVGRRANELLEGREHGLVGQALIGGGFGDAEINDLGHGHAVVIGHKYVGGFDIAMNDAFLVRVLNGPANLHEQIKPIMGGKVVLVAVIGDFDAAHQFHDKKRPARDRRARVQDPGNVRMIHQGQGLPFRLKPGDDRLGIHAQLDDLEGDSAPNGFLLFGHINHAATAFADLLQKFVAANAVAGFLGGDAGNTNSAG